MRDKLSPNSNLPNSLVYTPSEAWSNDDVWMFLMQMTNPWDYGRRNPSRLRAILRSRSA